MALEALDEEAIAQPYRIAAEVSVRRAETLELLIDTFLEVVEFYREAAELREAIVVAIR